MPTLHLHVERPGISAVARTFDGDAVVVGRSEQADIPVADESVSRRHARLFLRNQEWFVEDLGSRRGTLLNGLPVSAPTEVKPGDVVSVGSTHLRISRGGDTVAGHGPALDATGMSESVVSVLRPAAEMMRMGAGDAGAGSRLRLLNEVHRALARPISRGDLLDMILDRAFEVLKPEHGVIFLRGADGELYQAAERRSPKSTGPLLVSRRLAEEVTVKGAAALVIDAQMDERFSGSESVMMSGVRSIVAAPLLDAEGCLGMIALYSRMQEKRFTEQDLELLVSLAAAAALRVRNLALVEEAAQRQVLERELGLARDIQMGMIARRFPERPEIDVAARMRAARLVGGDLYDLVIDGDRLWFIVGDVAGKGMGAALPMAVALTLFRAVAPSGLSLGEVMSRVNHELCRDNDRAVFVTAFAGCLDLVSGRLSVANAGHNLPYRIGGDGTVQVLAARNGIALGVLEEAPFPITEVQLGARDGLMIYTDGVCDAVNPAGVAFADSRIEQCLAARATGSAADIVSGVFEAVDSFAAAAPQEDDITVVVIRYRGARV